MKKSLRSEILSIVAVLGMPAAIVLTFPFSAVKFNAASEKTSISPSVAFVQLSPDEEAAALRAAKGSGSSGAGGVKNLRAELYFGDLPASKNEPALDFSDRHTKQRIFNSETWPPPFMPSQAAQKPIKILPEKEAPEPETFSREELSKIE